MSSGSGKGPDRLGFRAAAFLASLVVATGLLAPICTEAEEEAGTSGQVEAGQQAPERRGPSVQITGNQSVAADVLRGAAAEELNSFRTGGFRDADADDAAYRMELAYRNVGYRFATVDYAVARAQGAEPVLSFVVNEGPRVRLEEIVIAGNDSVSTDGLKAFFATQEAQYPAAKGWFVEATIRAAVEEIRTYYYVNGYLDSSISEPRFSFADDRSAVTVHVSIVEGTAFVLRDVVFSGDVVAETGGALETLRKELAGQPYVPNRVAFFVENRVRDLYGDLGYPDVHVRVARIAGESREGEPTVPPASGKGGDVNLNAHIESGPRVSIGDVRITGNVKTRDEFILSRLALKPGDPYSAAKERDSFSSLYRTGLFSLVRISLKETEAKTIRTLLVELEELPSREISFELGWGSYEQLRGKAEARSKNFLGKGRILTASAGASLKSTDLELGYSDPWFLGRDLVLDLPIYYRTRIEPSFNRGEMGISSVVSKRFAAPKVGISVAYTLRHTQQSSVSAGAEEAGDDYNFASVKVQASRDTRDDPFFPSSGYRSLVAVEITDTILGSSLNFVRVTTTNRFFFSIGSRTVLAARYDTGFVAPTTEDLTLPLAERFFNGGASTVRSFGESELGPKDPETRDPIGGSAYNVFSVELRYRFKHNFGGTLFVDYGNISPSASDGIDRSADRNDFLSATFADYFSNFRTAVGAGVQYLLPVGPLRIDAAFNPSVNDNQGENAFTVHFTVGMAF